MPTERVVRKILADGTAKTYRYERHKAPGATTDSLGALLTAYRGSAEWRALSPNSRRLYSIYHQCVDQMLDLPVTALRRRDMLALRDDVAANRGDGAASSFVRTMSALMNWAIDREWLETSPMLRVKTPKLGHLRAWSEAEYEHALTMKLPETVRRLIILARHTGQRRGDLCAMTWKAYDGRRIHWTQQKTKESLVIPLSAEACADLDAWRRTATATTILTSRAGTPWEPDSATQAVMRWLPGMNIHGLRKLAATSLAQAGCTVHEIASITGHASLAMVQLYTKSVQQEQLAGDAIVRLAAFRAARK